MEIIPEGVHFRLVQDDELPSILEHLKSYLPEAIKVCILFPCLFSILLNLIRDVRIYSIYIINSDRFD